MMFDEKWKVEELLCSLFVCRTIQMLYLQFMFSKLGHLETAGPISFLSLYVVLIHVLK